MTTAMTRMTMRSHINELSEPAMLDMSISQMLADSGYRVGRAASAVTPPVAWFAAIMGRQATHVTEPIVG